DAYTDTTRRLTPADGSPEGQAGMRGEGARVAHRQGALPLVPADTHAQPVVAVDALGAERHLRHGRAHRADLVESVVEVVEAVVDRPLVLVERPAAHHIAELLVGVGLGALQGAGVALVGIALRRGHRLVHLADRRGVAGRGAGGHVGDPALGGGAAHGHGVGLVRHRTGTERDAVRRRGGHRRARAHRGAAIGADAGVVADREIGGVLRIAARTDRRAIARAFDDGLRCHSLGGSRHRRRLRGGDRRGTGRHRRGDRVATDRTGARQARATRRLRLETADPVVERAQRPVERAHRVTHRLVAAALHPIHRADEAVGAHRRTAAQGHRHGVARGVGRTGEGARQRAVELAQVHRVGVLAAGRNI
ncbi:hypothetical protein KCV01_g24432, partial [Aureobasidium melanogenum]